MKKIIEKIILNRLVFIWGKNKKKSFTKEEFEEETNDYVHDVLGDLESPNFVNCMGYNEQWMKSILNAVGVSIDPALLLKRFRKSVIGSVKIKSKIPDKFMEKFMDLSCQMSPENLHEDGEASLSRVNQKLKQLRAEWVKLEKECGKKVTEKYVWDEYYKKL